MTGERRTYRVAQLIREKLAERLLESADDRFRLVTITGVQVTKDLRLAKVYWTTSDPENRKSQVKEAFDRARGFFRAGLADGLSLRAIPELRFYYDNTLDTAEQIDELMKRAQSRNGSAPGLSEKHEQFNSERSDSDS